VAALFYPDSSSVPESFRAITAAHLMSVVPVPFSADGTSHFGPQRVCASGNGAAGLRTLLN
jgi:hypothetical protein